MVVRLHKLTKKGRLIDNSERFVVYDLANDTVMWFADDDFLVSRVVKYGTFYLHIEKNKCSRLNGETGKRLWTAPFFVYHVDPVRKIALGYKIDKSRSTTILQGLNLVDGKVLWERSLSKRYGWNEAVSLDTSSVLVVSEGLHLVRLNDGSGWDYSAVTGELNTAEGVASISALTALTIAAALNGSFISMPTPPSQVVYDVVSNVCQDSAGFYFAAKNQISCVDLNGQLKWCTDLPDNVTSKSFLIKNGNTLYLINTGYAYRNQKQIPYGNPFISAYDALTGRKAFFKSIHDSSSPINNYKFQDDTLYLLFDDRIVGIRLANGSLVYDKTVECPDEKMMAFAGSKICVKTDKSYPCLALRDLSQHCILMDNNDVWVLNNNMDLVQKIKKDDYYIHYLDENEYSYFAHGNKTIVVNAENEIMATLDIFENLYKRGSKLFAVLKKSVIVVSLNDIP